MVKEALADAVKRMVVSRVHVRFSKFRFGDAILPPTHVGMKKHTLVAPEQTTRGSAAAQVLVCKRVSCAKSFQIVPGQTPARVGGRRQDSIFLPKFCEFCYSRLWPCCVEAVSLSIS